MTDEVNEPEHYNKAGIEVIDVIEAYDLPYHLGNVVKYILRHQYKGKPRQDLEKAQWYLDRYLDDAVEFAEAAPDTGTITAEELLKEIEAEKFNPIERMTTHEEAMTDSGLCPFRDEEGYVHGTHCGCSVLVPTVTSWPGSEYGNTNPWRKHWPKDAYPYPGTPAQAHEAFLDSLPGATTPPETLTISGDTATLETFVATSPSNRVGGQADTPVYDGYYGFNDDEVISKCGLDTCHKDIQAKDSYFTVGTLDFCGAKCLANHRAVHGV